MLEKLSKVLIVACHNMFHDQKYITERILSFDDRKISLRAPTFSCRVARGTVALKSNDVKQQQNNLLGRA